MTTARLLATAALAVLACACAGPSFSGRPTTASVARSDDPWLVGERCTPDTPAEPSPRTQVLLEGTGAPVTPGTTVRVRYVASLPDGKVVHDSENMPSEIILGSSKILCGLERALAGMRPGEERRVVVPWQLAFGEEGHAPEVPPRTDVTFVLDLYLPADVSSAQGSHPVNPAGGGGRRR
jgi:hypothetical protein